MSKADQAVSPALRPLRAGKLPDKVPGTVALQKPERSVRGAVPSLGSSFAPAADTPKVTSKNARDFHFAHHAVAGGERGAAGEHASQQGRTRRPEISAR